MWDMQVSAMATSTGSAISDARQIAGQIGRWFAGLLTSRIFCKIMGTEA